MVRKLYKKLTDEQKARGVIFASTLSTQRIEQPNDTIQEVLKDAEDRDVRIYRLLDDKFFNKSHWKYNIVRVL